MSYSVEYQLGIFVGEYIVSHYLPTLNIDGWNTRKVIAVPDVEVAEYERLHELWWEKVKYPNQDKDIANKEWNAMYIYRKMLQEKYMPHILECHLRQIRVEDVISLKKGIRTALWDCDMCSYNCEQDDIEIVEDGFFTVIRFPLDKTIRLEPE